MDQSSILQEMKELRELKNTIREKTGYNTKVYIMKTDDVGGREYQVHVSADDKTWKYVNVPFEDVDEAFYEFMFSLLQRPDTFITYSVGKYGLLLEDALNAHEMTDIGYTISCGDLVSHGMSGDDTEVETLCKCADISKLSVISNEDYELDELVIITKNKKITIGYNGHRID